MRRIVFYLQTLVLALIVVACGNAYKGNLLGSLDRPIWYHIMPYGMVYVPTGTLHIGPGDQDVNFALVQRSKQVSIPGFYMDDTEISNNEYRQFVEYIRDSIAHKLIGDEHIIETEQGTEIIDWTARIRWDDEETQELIEELYYPEEQRFWGKKTIDPRKLNYEYSWVDYKEAAKNKIRERNGEAIIERKDLIKTKTINVYPDTLVWIRDFSYAYNEPMARNYFSHPAYDNYPVVGVSWVQATAFSIWRTRLFADWRSYIGESPADEFRLPTEFEWEYAARGGKRLSPFPWGGPYVRNGQGCILANFKPGRGNYPDDGGLYTVKVNAYWANDFGLYNMSGNVAEWTANAFEENVNSFEHDFNPDYRYDAKEDDPITLKRKVIRGGSWKDISYYMHTGTRTYEYQDTTKSYIGFRCVMSFLGRSLNDRIN